MAGPDEGGALELGCVCGREAGGAVAATAGGAGEAIWVTGDFAAVTVIGDDPVGATRRTLPAAWGALRAAEDRAFPPEAEGGRGGARPLVTDRGSEDRPMCCPASRLADQATAAVTTIPSSAAADHRAVRLVISPDSRSTGVKREQSNPLYLVASRDGLGAIRS